MRGGELGVIAKTEAPKRQTLRKGKFWTMHGWMDFELSLKLCTIVS